eukprot:5631515-Pleurochrysis_carterae.AAC.1
MCGESRSFPPPKLASGKQCTETETPALGKRFPRPAKAQHFVIRGQTAKKRLSAVDSLLPTMPTRCLYRCTRCA